MVLDGATGTEQWRVPLSAYGYGQPSAGNVTGELAPEIVTSDIGGTLVVVHGNGTVAWRAEANTTVWTRPELGRRVRDNSHRGFARLTPRARRGDGGDPLEQDGRGNAANPRDQRWRQRRRPGTVRRRRRGHGARTRRDYG